jgi:K+-transporting ATPase KdpF subunit
MPRVADHGAQGRGGTFSDKLMHVNRASRKACQLRAAVVSRKEQTDVGPDSGGRCHRRFRGVDRLRLRLRPALKEATMIFDYSLAGLVTVGLMIYLIFALLKPERF